MNTTQPTSRYSTLSIALHWLMLLLFIAVYACIELRELYPKGSDPREALKTWHFMLGLSVFVLVWLRLFARVASATPSIVPNPPGWQMVLAKLVHLAPVSYTHLDVYKRQAEYARACTLSCFV